MAEPILYVGTPLAGGMVHRQYMAGALSAVVAFSGRMMLETQVGSFLPRNRDILTARFLSTPATHMLCVDSDIGWTAADAQKLLDTGKPFVSGCYAKKQADRAVPTKLTGERDGDLLGAEYAPGGFLLLSRACVERMVGAYRTLGYNCTNEGQIWGLWAPLFVPGKSYDGEDVSFCKRWTALGEKVWMHPGVIVNHYGDHCYTPDPLS